MSNKAIWYGLAGAAAAAYLLTPKTARAAPLPPPDFVPPSGPPDDDELAPPPASGGYAPDPLLGGGTPDPNRPAMPPTVPAAPVLGLVLPGPNGSYLFAKGGRYRAHVEINAPAFLVNEPIVAAQLTAAGFRVLRTMRTTGSNFTVDATRTGPSGPLTPPERVRIVTLERLA